MNYSIIRYVIGTVLKFESFFLCLPMLVGIFYGERSGYSFMMAVILTLALGLILGHRKPKSYVFYATEGFVTVALSWFALSLFGAIPFWISGEIPSFTDALFEAISGFTTTGASILSNVEGLSHACLIWRSFTHWIGGMGILVFVLAVFPMHGGHIMFLMKAESPGPSVEKLVPRVKTTAIILYAVYSALTVAEMIALAIGGMSIFGAVNIGLATAGTGGFGILNDSAGSYAPHLQIIITVFMILFGVNFNAYYLILSKKFLSAFRSEEVRTYFLIIIGSALLIAYNIRGMYATIGEALRHSFFQVASIITTTGFSTVDFTEWPQLSNTILIGLMFVGACAGSTGGGMKVSRFLIMWKTAIKELFTIKHPHGVKTVKIDGRVVEHETIRAVNIYVIIYAFLFAASVLLISLDNYDFGTNFTAVSATINNIGPGISKVGPAENFGFFSNFSKYILMFDMLAGRLELMPMIVLFAPMTWKKNK